MTTTPEETAVTEQVEYTIEPSITTPFEVCMLVKDQPIAHFYLKDDALKMLQLMRTRPAPDPAKDVEGLQAGVANWMQICFGPEITADKLERSDRFIEEALELVQACNYSKDRAHELVEYVFNRPKGEKGQEVGGVMITLAALCGPHGLSMDDEGKREYQRIMQPQIVEKIRKKQATKPTGSSLPIPVSALQSTAAQSQLIDELGAALQRLSKAEGFDAERLITADPYAELNMRRKFAQDTLAKVRDSTNE